MFSFFITDELLYDKGRAPIHRRFQPLLLHAFSATTQLKDTLREQWVLKLDQ